MKVTFVYHAIIKLFAGIAFLMLGAVVMYNNAREPRNKLTRKALLPPSLSAWRHLYYHGDDASFVNLIGFTKSAFKQLLHIVFPTCNNGIKKRGRRQLLTPADKLGLYLMYLSSRMDNKMIFGCVPSSCATILDDVQARVVVALRNHPKAEVKFPDQDGMAELAARVQQREPSINNVIGFVDGVSLPIQCSEDPTEQDANYNGYHHDTRCNNVFALSSVGKFIYACMNYPGS